MSNSKLQANKIHPQTLDETANGCGACAPRAPSQIQQTIELLRQGQFAISNLRQAMSHERAGHDAIERILLVALTGDSAPRRRNDYDHVTPEERAMSVFIKVLEAEVEKADSEPSVPPTREEELAKLLESVKERHVYEQRMNASLATSMGMMHAVRGIPRLNPSDFKEKTGDGLNFHNDYVSGYDYAKFQMPPFTAPTGLNDPPETPIEPPAAPADAFHGDWTAPTSTTEAGSDQAARYGDGV